jgi:hypothetical protein
LTARMRSSTSDLTTEDTEGTEEILFENIVSR